MRRLGILGASGHAKVVADAAILLDWDEVSFFDDAWPKKIENGRWPILGDTKLLLEMLHEFDGIIVGIGDCDNRWQKHRLLSDAKAPLIKIVHPYSCISPYSKIGVGSVIFAGAVINIDATIGESCIVNTGATIDHDCIISDAVHIAPGVSISGNVTIAERSWIGTGAVIKQGVKIGSDVMVGAGAVVVKDVSDRLTVMGNPAREFARN